MDLGSYGGLFDTGIFGEKGDTKIVSVFGNQNFTNGKFYPGYGWNENIYFMRRTSVDVPSVWYKYNPITDIFVSESGPQVSGSTYSCNLNNPQDSKIQYCSNFVEELSTTSKYNAAGINAINLENKVVSGVASSKDGIGKHNLAIQVGDFSYSIKTSTSGNQILKTNLKNGVTSTIVTTIKDGGKCTSLTYKGNGVFLITVNDYFDINEPSDLSVKLYEWVESGNKTTLIKDKINITRSPYVIENVGTKQLQPAIFSVYFFNKIYMISICFTRTSTSSSSYYGRLVSSVLDMKDYTLKIISCNEQSNNRDYSRVSVSILGDQYYISDTKDLFEYHFNKN